jgi:hypothetical protein
LRKGRAHPTPWCSRSAGNTPQRQTRCPTARCTPSVCVREAIWWRVSRRCSVRRAINASCGSGTINYNEPEGEPAARSAKINALKGLDFPELALLSDSHRVAKLKNYAAKNCDSVRRCQPIERQRLNCLLQTYNSCGVAMNKPVRLKPYRKSLLSG